MWWLHCVTLFGRRLALKRGEKCLLLNRIAFIAIINEIVTCRISCTSCTRSARSEYVVVGSATQPIFILYVRSYSIYFGDNCCLVSTSFIFRSVFARQWLSSKTAQSTIGSRQQLRFCSTSSDSDRIWLTTAYQSQSCWYRPCLSLG
jgi:hypothetical protein